MTDQADTATIGHTGADTDTPNDLGQRLRALRKQHGLTLREAGDRIGMSHSLLSQLELGRSSASLTTLTRLAVAYGTTLAQLFDDRSEQGAERVVRRHERVSMPCIAPNIVDFLVAPSAGEFSVLVSVVEPRSEGSAIEQTGNRKLLFVLQGVTDVRVGDRTHTLHEGDAIYFDASEPHSVANPGWESAEILCVVSLQMDAL